MSNTLTSFLCFVTWTIALLSIATTSHAADAGLKDAAELVKARTDYQRFLVEQQKAEAEIQLRRAEATAKYAEAERNTAEAEYAKAKAGQMRAYLKMMQEEYDRIRREEQEVKYRIHDVRVHSDLCAGLADGITRNGGFQCLQYFRRYMVSFALQRRLLFDEKVDALPAAEFIGNYPSIPTENFPGGNTGQLIVFAETKDFSFIPFGRAHTHLVGFLDAISMAAKAKIQEYMNYIDGVRAGRLDVFKLPKE